MKFNIQINQKAIVESGFEIDVIDAIILDFMFSFSKSDSIVSIRENDTDFFWFSHDNISKELPLLKLKKDSIFRRLKTLSKNGFLIQSSRSQVLGRSFYAFTDKVEKIRFTPSEKKPDVRTKINTVGRNASPSDENPKASEINPKTPSEIVPNDYSHNSYYQNKENTSLFSEENNVPKKSNSKKPVVKKSEQKESCPVYKEAVDVYFSFYKDLNGVNPKFDVADGKSMKALISYFKSVHKDKSDGSDQNKYVLQNLKYIFDNWNKQVDFIRNQTKMTQINSNINNIINKLKSGKSTSNNGTNGGNKIVGKSQKFTIDEFVKSSSDSEK